jgi:hypothetical protein
MILATYETIEHGVISLVKDNNPKGNIYYVAEGLPKSFRLIVELVNTPRPYQGHFEKRHHDNAAWVKVSNSSFWVEREIVRWFLLVIEKFVIEIDYGSDY